MYAYALGDPVNNTDRRGLFSSAEDCIDDPDGCEGEDFGCYTPNGFTDQPGPECGDGGGGGGGEDQEAPLSCAFAGALSGAPTTGTFSLAGAPASGFFLPITFGYFADGGTGNYQWSNSQNVAVSGYITYGNGYTLNLGSTSEETLAATTDGGHYLVTDTPGVISPLTGMLNGQFVSGVQVLSAVFVFNAVETAYLRDGPSTVACPSVWWQAVEIWQAGEPVVWSETVQSAN